MWPVENIDWMAFLDFAWRFIGVMWICGLLIEKYFNGPPGGGSGTVVYTDEETRKRWNRKLKAQREKRLAA